MIGYNHLGKNGRLGNQMFQYAALRGIADKHEYDFMIPETVFHDQWNQHQLYEAFDLPNLKHKGFVSSEYYKEDENHSHVYSEKYVNNCLDDVSLFGYFQTEKYFENISDSIREDFKFKDVILNPCKRDFTFDKIISLHVRRTDYLEKSQYHPPCDFDYYDAALKMFDDNLPVLVFSDDSSWCMKHKFFSSDRFMVSESGSNLLDMCLMSLCSHHIIANSSFSWWGAWLSGSNDVVAPKKWYGPSALDVKTNDLIPERWKTL